ncbi:hypothetical protein DRP04_14460 [Archaeoglobales archaeon]|nr:MAG: hypothetical protein DRP04_14460 [Archaeoglobales archaeon]
MISEYLISEQKVSSIRLVLDSDVLVHALRVPKKEDLLDMHIKASKLFESCITGKNELFLPSTIPVEVGVVLSRILKQEVAREGVEKLLTVAEEVYPFTGDVMLNSIYSISSNIYFQKAIDNSIRFGRVIKDEKDCWVPGWKDRGGVTVSGMDILVMTYMQLKGSTCHKRLVTVVCCLEEWVACLLAVD